MYTEIRTLDFELWTNNLQIYGFVWVLWVDKCQYLIYIFPLFYQLCVIV